MRPHSQSASDRLSDEEIVSAIQKGTEETLAFDATSQWGYEKLMVSVSSRGDHFDRNAMVLFEESGDVLLSVPISSMPATIGCSKSADYVIDRAGISRLHCHLESIGGLVRINDDESTNGVWLNGKRIQSQELCDGDELTLGTVLLRVRKV